MPIQNRGWFSLIAACQILIPGYPWATMQVDIELYRRDAQIAPGLRLSVIDIAPLYAPKLAGTEGNLTVLDLTLRPGKESEYPKLKMWVDPTRATITKIEYLDATGKKLRTAERLNFTEDAPGHFSPGKMVYTDHRRGNHQTELILIKATVNNGYTDDQFTQRALTRE